jgi:hypothetical protein
VAGPRAAAPEPRAWSRLVTKVAISRQPHSRLVAALTQRVVPEIGSKTGAAKRRKVRSDAVTGSQTMFVTSGGAD